MAFARMLLAVIALAGCGLMGGGPATISGRTFLSTGVVVDGEARPLVDGTRIRLVFGASGQLSAEAGCNTMGGTYRLEGGILTVDGSGMTEMGCDPDRHDQDEWLFGVLGSRPTLALSGNSLVITAGGTVITLLDREIAEPDLPLTGTLWTVSTIFFASDAGMGMSGGVTATLKFDAAGRVTFNTGCNEGGGRYVVDGSRIHFSDLITTDRACDGEAAQLEAAVVETLNGDPTWAIDADSLTLHVANGERGLGLTGTPGS